MTHLLRRIKLTDSYVGLLSRITFADNCNLNFLHLVSLSKLCETTEEEIQLSMQSAPPRSVCSKVGRTISVTSHVYGKRFARRTEWPW